MNETLKWFILVYSSLPVFSGVRVFRFLVLYVCFVDRCLSFCTFSFGHCVVCSSSMCGFWLLLWYLQTSGYFLQVLRADYFYRDYYSVCFLLAFRLKRICHCWVCDGGRSPRCVSVSYVRIYNKIGQCLYNRFEKLVVVNFTACLQNCSSISKSVSWNCP